MEYAATSEFPAAMQDRLSRIRTVTVEWDRDEQVMTATWREGITTPDDRRELSWVLGSRSWPSGWFWDLHEVPAFV